MSGCIFLEGYEEKNVQSASYDLTVDKIIKNDEEKKNINYNLMRWL